MVALNICGVRGGGGVVREGKVGHTWYHNQAMVEISDQD